MEFEENIKKAGGPMELLVEHLKRNAAYCIKVVGYDGLTDFVHHLQGELPLTNAPVGSYVVRELLKLMSERDEQLLWQYVIGQIGSTNDTWEIARCAELLATIPNAPKSLVSIVERQMEQGHSMNISNANAYRESPLLIAIITVVQRINSVMQVEKWKRGIKQRQTKIDEFASEKKTPVASEEPIKAPPPSPEMSANGARRKRGSNPVDVKVGAEEKPAVVLDAELNPKQTDAVVKRKPGRPRKDAAK